MDKITITLTVNISKNKHEGKFAKRIIVPDNLVVYLNHEALGMETARMIDKALENYRKNNKEVEYGL